MKLKCFLFGTIFLLPYIVFCQNAEYARTLIDDLCAPNFHGRGYVKNGDKKAAKYIVDKLKSYNVKKFENSFFQHFNISINTFPSDMLLVVRNKILKPGVDYLVSATSNTCKGTFKTQLLNKEILSIEAKLKKFSSLDLSEIFIVIDTTGFNDDTYKQLIDYVKYENPFNAKGIIEIVDSKLIYVPSRVEKNFVLIQAKKGSFDIYAEDITVNIKNKYYQQYKTQNIVGYIEGKTDSFIVFTAHYDHLGRMGKDIYFPGANDNASGVVTILDLAKHYAAQTERPHYSMAFIFFGGEEAGILGSKYYTEHPLFPLSKIRFLTNLDMVGSGDNGIQVVNGSVFKDEFDKLSQINTEKQYIKQVKIRGAAANSDHYFFYEHGVKCFFIYTLGKYKEYHNIFDTADAVPLIEYKDIFNLMIDFISVIYN